MRAIITIPTKYEKAFANFVMLPYDNQNVLKNLERKENVQLYYNP